MRSPLRALIGVAAAFLFCAAGADSPWRIGDGHALTWNGKPYTPIGLHIDGTPAAIEHASDLGFSDVCVDLPVGGEGWADAFAALQKHNLGFLININSLANFSDGYSIEPEGFRITRFKDGTPITVDIPGATSVLAILAASRDGEVLKQERVKTPGGHLVLNWPAPVEDDAVLLLYPRMPSTDLPDYFDGFDRQRDRLLRSLRMQKTTTGLRGIVNPFGTVVRLPPPDFHFVPSSVFFQLELARFLEVKYRSVDTCEQSWSMRAPDIDSFAKLATLVPLWSGERGLLQLWDPSNDQLYPIDSRRSLVWSDIQDVVNTAARRRVQFLTDAIHSLVQVPVVQDWCGWAIPYEGGAMVDGVGMQTEGTLPSDLMVGASRAASTVLRWKKPGWLIATRVDLAGAKPEDVGAVVDDLISVGARAIFARAEDPAVQKALVTAAGRYRVGGIPSDVVKAFFYPENATSPAEPQMLPGGTWWLPAPYDGNRLPFGSQVFAYRFNASDGNRDQFVYWVANGQQPVRLLVSDPRGASVVSIDGQAYPFHRVKNGIDLTLTSTPVVVQGLAEIPVPNIARAELDDHFSKLVVEAAANHVDTTQEATIYQNDTAGFDRTPGGSYMAMHDQYIALSRKMARYTWLEGERSESGNLGGASFIPGCSMDAAYRMQTKLSIPGERYQVTYTILPRTGAEQEVWIAARIPDEVRPNVRVLAGTQIFSLPDKPIEPYGLGFAWYHLGTTKFGRDPVQISVIVENPTGFDLAIDAIMITPDKFAPHDVERPDPINFQERVKKGRR